MYMYIYMKTAILNVRMSAVLFVRKASVWFIIAHSREWLTTDLLLVIKLFCNVLKHIILKLS